MAWSTYKGKGSKSKYGAHKTVVDGIQFDSIKEAQRFRELQLLERAGEITDLQRQVKFILIPAQREPDRVGSRGGIIKGKLIERECVYIADFVYHIPECSKPIVEDTKGYKTKEYIIKRKLLLWVHGIKIKEI